MEDAPFFRSMKGAVMTSTAEYPAATPEAPLEAALLKEGPVLEVNEQTLQALLDEIKSTVTDIHITESRLDLSDPLEALTKLFEVLPTDENTSDVEKGFMEITSSLPADSKPTELVQPCQRSFHHPPIDAQAAAVGLPSPSQHRADAPLTQGAPMGLRIIGPIPLHPIRPTTRAADPTGHRGYAIHQRQQLRHIMPMGPRHPRRQRHPLGIGDYMVFATGFAAVRRIGTGVRPPPTARTEALSTTARDQSIRSAALSRFNRI